MSPKYIILFITTLIGLSAHALSKVEIEERTNQWNIANNTQDFATLRLLFNKKVTFYGKKIEVSECLQAKRNIFEKYRLYSQVIISDFDIKEYNDGIVKLLIRTRW